MLERLNKELIDNKYISHIRIIGGRKCIYAYAENNLSSVFYVYAANGKLKVEYFLAQIPIEKSFNSIEQLLDFIKDVFPITNFKPK